MLKNDLKSKVDLKPAPRVMIKKGPVKVGGFSVTTTEPGAS